jgi:predicted Fe-S protein YdhL (DUF1289 family)
MRNLQEVFADLSKSSFRRNIRLQQKEWQYLREKGMDTVLSHAEDFIEKRLAPAEPANDGKQTPWRNHPVFVAQHATATCCRGCLEKWHAIAKGRRLSIEEKQHVVEAIRAWLSQYEREVADETGAEIKGSP